MSKLKEGRDQAFNEAVEAMREALVELLAHVKQQSPSERDLRESLRNLRDCDHNLLPFQNKLKYEERQAITEQVTKLKEKALVLVKALNPDIHSTADAFGTAIPLANRQPIRRSKTDQPTTSGQQGVKRVSSAPLSAQNSIEHVKSRRSEGQVMASMRKIVNTGTETLKGIVLRKAKTAEAGTSTARDSPVRRVQTNYPATKDHQRSKADQDLELLELEKQKANRKNTPGLERPKTRSATGTIPR